MMNLTGYDNPETTTVVSFVANLPELLTAMRADPRTVVAVADFADYRYVQFWAEGDALIAEVISNMNVPTHDALTLEQELALVEAGWQAPIDTKRPNFRMETTDDRGVFELAVRTADAVTRILGQGTTAELSSVALKTWAMNPRVPEGLARQRYLEQLDEVGAMVDDLNWDLDGLDWPDEDSDA
jgi:hypothetical protein